MAMLPNEKVRAEVNCNAAETIEECQHRYQEANVELLVALNEPVKLTARFARSIRFPHASQPHAADA